MKTRFLELEKNSATLDFSSGEGFTLRRANGKPIIQVPKNSPDPAAFASDDPAVVPTTSRLAQNALNTLLALDDAIQKVNSDNRWSDDGRKQNLLAIRIQSIKTLIAVDHDMLAVEKGLNEQRAQLYGVPPLGPNDVVGFLRDREIRDSLRDATPADTMALLSGQNTKDGIVADPSFILALLRSPVKAADLENAATEIWRDLAEEKDPVLYESIKIVSETLEWTRMVLGLVISILKREMLGYAGKALFDIVYPLGGVRGAALFGFTPQEVAQYQRTAA